MPFHIQCSKAYVGWLYNNQLVARDIYISITIFSSHFGPMPRILEEIIPYFRFSDGRYCNETCDNQAPCFPIPVPAGDPRIRRHRCIGTTRSSAMCGSGMTSVFFKDIMPREQMNQITGYIDASNVYGSSEEESYGLR